MSILKYKNMKQKIDLYLADMKESNDRLLCLSLVKEPAIESMLTILSKSEDEIVFAAPILIANKLVYRNSKALGEHYLLFLPDVISEIQSKAAIEKTIYRFDIDHKDSVSGVYMVENIIADFERGFSYFKGISGITDGSWIGVFKTNNKSVVDAVNSGEINGISISAMLTYEKVDIKDAIEIYNKLK